MKATLKYEIALLGVVIIWALNIGATKIAVQVMPPFVFNSFRFPLAVLLFGIIFWKTENVQAEVQHLKTHFKSVALLAFWGHILYQFCYVLSVRYTTSGNVALLVTSSPIWTAVSATILGTESMRRVVWIGLFVSFVGTMLIVLGTHQNVSFVGSEMILWGNIFAVCAAFSWGTHNALAKPLLNTFSPSGLMFFTMSFSVPFHLISAAPDLWKQGFDYPLVAWLCVFYSGLLSTGFAYIIWNAGIQNIGAARTSIFSNLIPLVALVMSVLYFKEALLLQQVIGGAMILGGLLLTRWRSK